MLERLQKIIARAGIASRRHAEELIRSGQVRLNGAVVTELGTKADPNRDRIEVSGKMARIAGEKAYLLLNKPPEVVSTLADPEGRRTLRNFLVGVSERVFPVGRLNYNASGIVFLTTDGELASRMLKAASQLPQTYWVKVKGRLSEDALREVSRAIRGKMRPLRPPHASGRNPANFWYEAELAGARRDLLRKNLLERGHPVEKLNRVRLATLELENVAEGHYRRLDAREVAKLSLAIDHALKGAPSLPQRPERAPARRSKTREDQTRFSER
jgi:23S rRNA pseudouridine2605 synthase